MKLIFADSSYFIALLENRDAFHAAALTFSLQNDRPLITPSAIILELGGRYSKVPRRPAFERVLTTLIEDRVEIVHVNPDLLERGIERFQNRPDQDWSLADCISFLVMGDRGITEAATTDEHFEQAGFTALLRQAAGGRPS